MLKNYLNTAFRGFLKHKGFTLINVSGLAIGIACCLLIFVYVKDELTHDRYHKNADQLYRITGTISLGGNQMDMASTSVIGPKIFAEEIPEIENFARLDNESGIVKFKEDYIEENRILFADKAMLEMFDFKVLAGDLSTALDNPDQLVITRQTAEKYFDRTDVVGEIMNMRLKAAFENFQISAVIENHPVNSSFNFRFLIPWTKNESYQQAYLLTNWGMISTTSFVQIRENADPQTVVDKMKLVREKHHPDSSSFARRVSNDLQRFQDIHLDGSVGGGSGMKASSNPIYSYVLSGIASLILIIACINFTNLTVARSLPRAREVGIRKVVGAARSQLSIQFLLETFILCLFSFVLGMIMAELLMPYFGELTEKSLEISIFDDPVLLLSSLVIVLITALFAGFYPAFVTSRFNVVRCLKGMASVRGKKYVTRGLIVAQFVIASVLIIGALTMRNQVKYMVQMDLGYDDTYLYSIDDFRVDEGESVLELFKSELSSNPNIINVSGSDGYGSHTSIRKDDGEEFLTGIISAEHDFFEIRGIELLRGRQLKELGDVTYTDQDTLTNVIVNEAFLEKMDWQDGLGKRVSNWQVVGVMPNFHTASARDEVGPLAVSHIKTDGEFATNIMVKFRPDYLPEIRGVLETTWRKFAPFYPFEAELLSEANASQYEDENRWNDIIYLASSLAIFISCMGLLGLAHLRTLQRTKEIGIRKVLGATVGQIILLLNSHFVRLVLLSVLIASPLAYYAIDQWLANFASRIPISWTLFMLPAMLLMGIAFAIVSLQSLKHARNNPVDALRYE